MPAEFLRDVVIQDRKKGRRLSMLPVSIAAHAAAGIGILIIPLAAEVEPPPVARLVPSYMSAMPVPAPPPPAVPVVRPALVANPDAAPTSAPDDIAPEVERPPAPPAIGLSAEGGLPSDQVGVGTGTAIVAPPPPPQLPPPDPPKLVRAGGDIKPPRKIVDVTPVYPELARSAGVGGVVILEAVINEDGVVEQVRALRPQPLLDAAAIAAVKRWRYTPTLLNGKPVSVLMTITVNFEMRE